MPIYALRYECSEGRGARTDSLNLALPGADGTPLVERLAAFWLISLIFTNLSARPSSRRRGADADLCA